MITWLEHLFFKRAFLDCGDNRTCRNLLKSKGFKQLKRVPDYGLYLPLAINLRAIAMKYLHTRLQIQRLEATGAIQYINVRFPAEKGVPCTFG